MLIYVSISYYDYEKWYNISTTLLISVLQKVVYIHLFFTLTTHFKQIYHEYWHVHAIFHRLPAQMCTEANTGRITLTLPLRTQMKSKILFTACVRKEARCVCYKKLVGTTTWEMFSTELLYCCNCTLLFKEMALNNKKVFCNVMKMVC